METIPKPRVQIDLKTVMFIMAFFGVGTFGGVIVITKGLLWHLIGPKAIEAIDAAVRQERDITSITVRKVQDSLINYSERRFDKIEVIFEEMPGGKKAIDRVERREQEKAARGRRLGRTSTGGGITIF